MYALDRNFILRLTEIAKDRPDLVKGEQIRFIREGMEFDSVVKNYPKIDDLLEAIFRSVAQEAPEAAEERIKYLKAIVASTHNKKTGNTARTLGHLLFACERFEEAIEAYEIGLHFYAHDADMLFKKAICHFNMKNTQECVNTLVAVLDLDPEKISADAEAKYYAAFLGDEFFDIDLNFARELYEFSLQIDDIYTPALLGLGDIALEEEEIEEAEENYFDALKTSRHSVEARIGLAICAQKREQEDEFLEWMQSCTKLQPKDFRAWLKIGDTYWKFGFREKATVAYSMAQEYAPLNPEVLSKLARSGMLEAGKA